MRLFTEASKQPDVSGILGSCQPSSGSHAGPVVRHWPAAAHLHAMADMRQLYASPGGTDSNSGTSSACSPSSIRWLDCTPEAGEAEPCRSSKTPRLPGQLFHHPSRGCKQHARCIIRQTGADDHDKLWHLTTASIGCCSCDTPCSFAAVPGSRQM